MSRHALVKFLDMSQYNSKKSRWTHQCASCIRQCRISNSRVIHVLRDQTASSSFGGDSGLQSTPSWYVAYTQPKREQLAATNLVHQGFEIYLPLYRTLKKSPDGPLLRSEPMFPRYIFFKPGVGKSLSTAKSTRGVSTVLSFGGQPATVKTDTLELIKQFETQRNSESLSQLSPFQPGELVRLTGKNLTGLEGLVTSVSSKRVNVLIHLLGGAHNMSVGHHQLDMV